MPFRWIIWKPCLRLKSKRMQNSGWKGICTLLPTAAFFLRMPYPPARQLLDSGAAIALASDYNPGSSPTGNMNMVIALACIQMKLLPEEAVNAATINGAFAMGLGNLLGTISIGKTGQSYYYKSQFHHLHIFLTVSEQILLIK